MKNEPVSSRGPYTPCLRFVNLFDIQVYKEKVWFSISGNSGICKWTFEWYFDCLDELSNENSKRAHWNPAFTKYILLHAEKHWFLCCFLCSEES
jgi:hypothetical protein